MNDDLISRKDALQLATALSEFDEGGWEMKVSAVKVDDLLNIPVVDAEPVRRGRWEWKEGAAYCTAHKGKLSPHVYGYAYCPWCGARMDGV